MKMPQTGRAWDEVRAEMVARSGGDVDWRGGKTAVYVFNAGEDVHQVQHDAYGLFMAENGLGPLAFPSLSQMERDVISMALGLLHGPEGSTGAITSGGTDSITMAMKTARDFARANGKPRAGQNIVLVEHDRARLAEGDPITIAVRPDDLHVFDPESGRALSHGNELAG